MDLGNTACSLVGQALVRRSTLWQTRCFRCSLTLYLAITLIGLSSIALSTLEELPFLMLQGVFVYMGASTTNGYVLLDWVHWRFFRDSRRHPAPFPHMDLQHLYNQWGQLAEGSAMQRQRIWGQSCRVQPKRSVGYERVSGPGFCPPRLQLFFGRHAFCASVAVVGPRPQCNSTFRFRT